MARSFSGIWSFADAPIGLALLQACQDGLCRESVPDVRARMHTLCGLRRAGLPRAARERKQDERGRREKRESSCQRLLVAGPMPALRRLALLRPCATASGD